MKTVPVLRPRMCHPRHKLHPLALVYVALARPFSHVPMVLRLTMAFGPVNGRDGSHVIEIIDPL